MLAKFVKKNSGTEFIRFSIPEIGDQEPLPENTDQFVFPSPLDMEPPVEPFGEEMAEEIAEEELSEEDILKKAREEAARIIAQAERDREMIEQAAREKGMQFVAKTVDTEVAARTLEMREQLAETIEKISALNAEITSGAEKDLVELALEIAKKIVGREVTIDREIALTLVKVSLSRLNNRAIARVHLNPDDFTYVQSHREKLDFHGSLEIVEDTSVSVGGCLVHTETGDIDARIESQFDEIAHGLLGS